MGPLEAVFIVVAAGIWLAFGAVCSSIARNKRRSEGGWFLLGLLIPLLALLFVVVLPPLPAPEGEHPETEPTLPPEGWYANPEEADEVRWWDGQQWTGATKAVESASA